MPSKVLKVIISGDAKGAVKAFHEVGAASETSGKKAGMSGKTMALGFATAGAAIGAFAVKSAKTYENVGTQVIKLERYTGLGAAGASRLRAAFKLTGVDTEKATKSIGLFSKNLVAGNVDKYTKAITGVGISTKDAHGKLLPMHDILLKVADRFKTMPPGAQRTALAMKLFGKAGADMLPFLSKGAAGIKELEKQSDKFGTTLGGKDLEAIKASKLANREFGLAMEGLQVQIGRYVLPVMEKFVSLMARNMPTAVHAVSTVMGGLGTVLGPVVKGFEALPGPVKGGVAAFGGMAAALYPLKKIVGGLGTVFGPAITGIKALVKTQEDGSRSVSKFGKVMGALSFVGAVAGLAAYGAALSKTKINSDAVLKGTTKDLAKFGIAVSTINPGALVKLGRESVPALKAMRAAVLATGQPVDAFDKALRTVSTETSRAAANTKKFGGSATDAAGRTKPLKSASELAAIAVAKMKAAAAAAKAKLDALKSSIDALTVKVFGLESANDSLHSSLNGLPAIITEVAKRGGGLKNVMSSNTDAAIAFRGQMRGIVGNAGEVVKAWVDQGVRGTDLNNRIRVLSTSLVDQAVKMGVPKRVAEQYTGVLGRIPTGVHTTITANAGEALTALDRVRQSLASMPFIGSFISNQLSHGIPISSQGGRGFNAQGNIHEAHTAQIAKAGEWRVWAEPETGGEAYIPLADSKRPRSKALAEEVVSRFGGQVSWMASGGVIDTRVVSGPVVAQYDKMMMKASAWNTANMAKFAAAAAAGAAAGVGGSIGPVSGGLIARILATIRHMESGNNYGARNPVSTASGAYQFLDSTWRGYGGFGRAYQAPPGVQDARAAKDVSYFLGKYGGAVESVPASWYTGSYKGHGNLNYHPGGPGNPLTVQGYVDRWLSVFNRTGAPAGAPGGGKRAYADGGIPSFANGGTFHAPQRGGAGLAVLHDGEHVSKSGGGDIHIHVAGSVLSERALVDVIARARRRGVLAR